MIFIVIESLTTRTCVIYCMTTIHTFLVLLCDKKCLYFVKEQYRFSKYPLVTV